MFRSAPNSRFLRRPGGWACADPAIPEETVASILADPQSLLQSNLDRPVKLDLGSLVVEASLPSDQGPIRIFYKRYRATRWWKKLLSRLRPSRALRVWRLARAMRDKGINTPQPLVACSVRAGWQRHGYLAVRWVEGAENLYAYSARLAGMPAAERLRRAGDCAEGLGRLLGHMHRQRLIHGDLKSTNILITVRASAADASVVDLDAARFARRDTLGRRAADLARLAVSLQAHPWIPRTVICRFFRIYAQESGLTGKQWKGVWRQASDRSRRILEKKRRRGQPIW